MSVCLCGLGFRQTGTSQPYLGLQGQLAPPDSERTLSMRSTCGVQYKGARTRGVSSRFGHVMLLCCFQAGFARSQLGAFGPRLPCLTLAQPIATFYMLHAFRGR